MVATRFKFKDTDEVVRARLNADERGRVARWQTNDDYSFEFHDGHTTGNPIYFRPEGNGDTTNIPKIDTKNKTASDYHGKANTATAGVVTVNAFANGEKLAGLKAAAKQDIEAIVSQSWTQLQTLANRVWNNIQPPLTEAQIREAEANAPQDTKDCTATAGCTGQVPFYGQGQKAMCPNCFKFC